MRNRLLSRAHSLLMPWLRRHPAIYNLAGVVRGFQPIVLDYPLQTVPRYGFGKPPHAALYGIINQGRAQYTQLLRSFLMDKEPLLALPLRAKGETEPYWRNRWLSGLDLVALYCLIKQVKPRLFLEIGSGISTKVARRAIRDGTLAARMISIDPQPREEIDTLCDQIIRQPAEDVALDVFASLQAGDILFIDGSHRCFMNSDVTALFLDVLPQLKPGVLVHVHDVYLPYDYPHEWTLRFYSEQYLLAAFLLGSPGLFEILLPNAFIGFDPELKAILEPFWSAPGLLEVGQTGSSFWLRKQ